MDDVQSLLGLVAACLTTLSFLPQVLKVIQTRNTNGISLTMYVAFITGVLCWLGYGLLLEDLPMILANLVTFLLAAVVLGYKLRLG